MADVLKVQGTIRGFSAFAVDRLMKVKGESLSDITKMIFDSWIDQNRAYLQTYQVTHQDYLSHQARQERKVVDIDRTDTG